MAVQNTTPVTGTWSLPKLDVSQFVVLALLVGLDIVLGKLTVGTNVLKISFVFVAMSLIAKWYGPVWTMMIATILDVVGATIINPSGTFFLGFTLSAITAGLIYALFYYNQVHVSWLRILGAVGLVTFVVNAGMNTLWLFIMYSQVHTWDSFVTILIPRLIKSIMMYPIQVIVTYAFLNNAAVKQATKKIFNK